MKLMKKVGKISVRSPLIEKGIVSLGHRFPEWALTRSLCYHAGEQIFLSAPDAAPRTAVLWNGIPMQVTLEEYAWREIYFYGVYEPPVTSVIKHLAAPGQIWIDLGANIGYFTMMLSSIVGHQGKVFAFEPNPTIADMIETSLHLNNVTNVCLSRMAVSESSGEEVVFYIPIDRTVYGSMSGRASLIAQRDIAQSQYREVRVTTITLDSFLAQATNGKVDFMKIDIEGAEILAFKGMHQTLEQCPPKAIICEVSHHPDCLATPQELIGHLMQFNYRPYRIRPEGLFHYHLGEELDGDSDKDIAFVQESQLALVRSLVVSQ